MKTVTQSFTQLRNLTTKARKSKSGKATFNLSYSVKFVVHCGQYQDIPFYYILDSDGYHDVSCPSVAAEILRSV
jgi:hypothetical protein